MYIKNYNAIANSGLNAIITKDPVKTYPVLILPLRTPYHKTNPTLSKGVSGSWSGQAALYGALVALASAQQKTTYDLKLFCRV